MAKYGKCRYLNIPVPWILWSVARGTQISQPLAFTTKLTLSTPFQSAALQSEVAMPMKLPTNQSQLLIKASKNFRILSSWYPKQQFWNGWKCWNIHFSCNNLASSNWNTCLKMGVAEFQVCMFLKKKSRGICLIWPAMLPPDRMYSWHKCMHDNRAPLQRSSWDTNPNNAFFL